nr:hypothetical protein [Catenibacterium mitsuokai]
MDGSRIDCNPFTASAPVGIWVAVGIVAVAETVLTVVVLLVLVVVVMIGSPFLKKINQLKIL